MKRYSKKRQAVLDCLRSTQTHPTAEWVYSQLKPDFPDLSLATVYRNLTQLRQAGLVASVGIVKGEERFDAVVAPHAHAVCTQCGKMVDVARLPFPEAWQEEVSAATGFAIAHADMRFSGLCRDCREAMSDDRQP